MNYFFAALLFPCIAYAFLAGGAPERIGAAVYALAAVGSHLIMLTHGDRWLSIEVGVFIVDVLLFISFTILALRANRFWPLWVSALLGLGVLGHLARLGGPGMYWWAYVVTLTIWSYPILGLIALGTWAHRRRLARNGVDPSWSNFSAPSGRPPPPTGPTT
jgi:hypothetical protein